MGYSYVSNAQKQSWNNEFNNIHATFARPIVIYKTAKQIVINPNPENNVFFQGAPFNSETEVVQQSGIFQARILYGKKEPLNQFNAVQYEGAGQQNIIRLKEGEVRIKLDPTGAAFIAGAERVTFDGTIFEVVADKRPHGLFDPNFETFFLKKLN